MVHLLAPLPYAAEAAWLMLLLYISKARARSTKVLGVLAGFVTFSWGTWTICVRWLWLGPFLHRPPGQVQEQEGGATLPTGFRSVM